MSKFTNPLNHVRIAAPCTAAWGRMSGTERARYCSQCNLNVYNLSGMSKAEAEALLDSSEGRLCVRFYRRADGTILTQNCPVRLRALKHRAARAAGGALSAVLSFCAGVGLSGATSSRGEHSPVMGAVVVPVEVAPPTRSDLQTQVEMGEMVMGRVLIPREDEALDDDGLRGAR